MTSETVTSAQDCKCSFQHRPVVLLLQFRACRREAGNGAECHGGTQSNKGEGTANSLGTEIVRLV